MFSGLVARRGKRFARLRFNAGPKGEMLIPVEVDYSVPFEGSDHESWKREYAANIEPDLLTAGTFGLGFVDPLDHERWLDELDPTIEQDELELLARTQDMSPDELEDLFNNNEVTI